MLIGINSWLLGKPETTTDGANETYLKTDLTPSALFHQTNLTLPPLDPQSWIPLIPIVSHVSECSTIRKAFALSRREHHGLIAVNSLRWQAQKRRLRFLQQFGSILGGEGFDLLYEFRLLLLI